MMKRALRVVALALSVAALGCWLALGANRGWTHTSVPVKTVDEVTGIEGIQYRKQFVPGIDFLGLSLMTAGSIALMAMFWPKSQSSNTTSTQ